MANGNYQQNMQTQQMPRHAQQYQQYQQYPPRQVNFQENSYTTTGQWVLTLFLLAIPIVNIVLLFVWAFGSNTEPSKQNWARAYLIWALIGIIVFAALIVAAQMMGINVWEYIRYPF